jgi:membrane fusion protein, heavy metal efflux system
MTSKSTVIVFAIAMAAACEKEQALPAAAAPAAKVSQPTTEAQLNTITLTSDTEKRLAIALAPVEHKPVSNTRLVGGEVVIPPGMTIDVTAPVAGTLAESGAPTVGREVRQGDTLFRLAPLQAGDRDVRINAARDLATARTAHEAALRRAARADLLLKDGSGSRRAAEEAHAELQTAQAAFEAATERLAVVNRSHLSESHELIVRAPISGVVENVRAQPGQTVPAGAPLAQIAREDRLWVRVPVYAGDSPKLDPRQGATVVRLGESTAAPGVQARQVAAPASATPAASAIDLWFELPPGSAFQPGERVNVRLVAKGSQTATVVSHTALVHDIHGGTWVYVSTAPHVFARQRVEVSDVVNGLALLTRGPAVNTPVVITGAAELYGVEFGAGK